MRNAHKVVTAALVVCVYLQFVVGEIFLCSCIEMCLCNYQKVSIMNMHLSKLKGLNCMKSVCECGNLASEIVVDWVLSTVASCSRCTMLLGATMQMSFSCF